MQAEISSQHTAPVHPLTEVVCNFSVQQDVLIDRRLGAQQHCCVLDLELLTEPAHIDFPLARVTRSPDRFLNLKIQEGHGVNKKPGEQRPFVLCKHRKERPGHPVAQLDSCNCPCHTGHKI